MKVTISYMDVTRKEILDDLAAKVWPESNCAPLVSIWHENLDDDVNSDEDNSCDVTNDDSYNDVKGDYFIIPLEFANATFSSFSVSRAHGNQELRVQLAWHGENKKVYMCHLDKAYNVECTDEFSF